MTLKKSPVLLVASILGVGFAASMTGCDYWPPALQVQIEQLQSDMQTLMIEKAQLQAQVTDLSRIKQDLQTQLDELNRVNQEKTTIITDLQNQLQAVRQKSLKAAGAHTPTKRMSAKLAPKPTAKAPARQQPPRRPTGVR